MKSFLSIISRSPDKIQSMERFVTEVRNRGSFFQVCDRRETVLSLSVHLAEPTDMVVVVGAQEEDENAHYVWRCGPVLLGQDCEMTEKYGDGSIFLSHFLDLFYSRRRLSASVTGPEFGS